MINNIKKNKNQHNDSIEYEPKFDNKFSLSSGTKNPIPVVTVSLRGGKKQMATIISGLTCLWYSRPTYSINNSQHTKPRKRNMSSNKVE